MLQTWTVKTRIKSKTNPASKSLAASGQSLRNALVIAEVTLENVAAPVK